MEEFITKIFVLKDTLTTMGESLKESEIILIALGALGEEYKSFVTSITTRFDPVMTFVALCELLMDREIQIQRNSLVNPILVNAAVKYDFGKLATSSPK